jgi:protein-S-isoprenylcysteine O-methyltransferase Ste14
MYLGTAAVMGTWLAVVGLVLAGMAYWRKTWMEEENLRVAFGPDYESYCRHTRALVPWVF